MKVKVETISACRKVMHIEIAPEGIAGEYGAVVKSYAEAVRIPGFRKGKAPLEVVERRYAKDISEEAKDRLVPRFYKEALEQVKIEPVAVVSVHDVKFGKGEGLSLNVTIDVAPEFRLPRYKRIRLTGKEVTVTDNEVNDAFERLLDTFARFEDAKRTDVHTGDLVRMDFQGICEGKPVAGFSPNSAGIGEGKDFWIYLGGRDLLPGLNQAVVGASTNETRNIRIHFPDDYQITELAGKDAEYTAIVKEIRAKVLPEINEELLKKYNVGSKGELWDKVRSDLLEVSKRNEGNRLKDEISKYLLENTKLELPQSVVEQEKNLMVYNIIERASVHGATRDMIEAKRADILSTAARSSEERVKLWYILDKIADEEGIKADGNEVQKRIEVLAESNKVTPGRLKSELERRGGMERLEREIRTDKTLDYILEQAKVRK